MATPITENDMKNMAEEALSDVFDAIKNRRWTVFVDYDVSEMRWRIAEVKPWHIFGTYDATKTIHIDNAPDELGAYAQALERLEQSK